MKQSTTAQANRQIFILPSLTAKDAEPPDMVYAIKIATPSFLFGWKALV